MMKKNNKEPFIIGKLESLRKNESNIFKDSRFRPENITNKKPLNPLDKKPVIIRPEPSLREAEVPKPEKNFLRRLFGL